MYEEQNVTGNRHHGFNKGKPYMASLIVSCDEMIGPADKVARAVDVIYFDFSKSFELVFHKMRYGLNKVLKISLKSQAQRIMISKTKSRFQAVTSSSPQETIAGSPLKYLYIT